MTPSTGTKIFDLRTDIFEPLKEKAEDLREQAIHETAKDKPLRKAYNSLCDVLNSLNEKLDLENKKDNDLKCNKFSGEELH